MQTGTAEPGRLGAPTARTAKSTPSATACCRRTRWASCRRPAPATSSSTSRAIRCGRTRRTGLGAGVPVRRGRAPAGPGAAPRVQAILGARGRRRTQAFLDFLDYVRTPPQVPGHARLPLRHLRENGAAAALAACMLPARTPWTSWLREGVLVDLYDTVRNSLRISEKLLQHQETRAALHGGQPALRGREGRRRFRGGLRPVLRAARRRQ